MKTIQLGGKQYATFDGVLDEAHSQGLETIATSLIQAPTAENPVAIVHAKVKTSKGEFNGIGDAGPGNVNRMIAPHVIRMAETRAIGRALRFATNAPTLAEELGEDAKQPRSNGDNGGPFAPEKPKQDKSKLEQHLVENEAGVNRFVRHHGMVGIEGTWRDLEPDVRGKIKSDPRKFFDAVALFNK